MPYLSKLSFEIRNNLEVYQKEHFLSLKRALLYYSPLTTKLVNIVTLTRFITSIISPVKLKTMRHFNVKTCGHLRK